MDQLTGSSGVCGDVSLIQQSARVAGRFSPRMRGCFASYKLNPYFAAVLPAYAGMFPAMTPGVKTALGSPRVCGDVSLASDSVHCFHWFSLRMRGCFPACEARERRRQVFPAYAGLFLFLKAWRQNYSGYSRAKEITRHHAVYSACSLVILTIGTVMLQFRYTIQMVVYENKI